jgi:superfamily I DNA and/or RNA helicase
MPIPFLGYVAASLGVAAVMALGKCLFDDLSEDERRKQKQIENNFEAYQSANEKRRSDFAVEYKRKIEEKRRDSAHDAYLYRKRILEQIRVANRPFFDKVIVELDEQIQTYQELNKQVYNSLQKLKDEAISASETSILRGDSLRVIKDECYESLTELKAYVYYLLKYRNKLVRRFEREGKLLSPFFFRLPQNVPYIGRVMQFEYDEVSKGSFSKEVQEGVYYNYICEDKEQLTYYKEDDLIFGYIVGIRDASNNAGKKIGVNYIISICKGRFMHSLALQPNLQFEAVVREINRDGNKYYYKLDCDGMNFILRPNDCISPKKKVALGTKKQVFIKRGFPKNLEKIFVTENEKDIFNFKSFSNIPLFFNNEDYEMFVEKIEKLGMGFVYDDWYFGPTPEENILKCQLGTRVIFYCYYENIIIDGNSFPYLRFLRFEDDIDEKLFACNEIYAVVDASLNCYGFDDIKDLDKNIFHASKELNLYLVSEFIKQQKIKKNQKNILYFNQWSVLMSKLVNLKSKGKTRTIRISYIEENKFYIFRDDISQVQKLFKLIYKAANRFQKKYTTNVYLNINDEDKVYIKFSPDFSFFRLKQADYHSCAKVQEYLNLSGFTVELCEEVFPYPEIRQHKALEDFRIGRILNNRIKETVFNLPHSYFLCNDICINTIYNPSIVANERQLESVIRAMAKTDLFLIQGPPGTGKTTVIKEIIKQQLEIKQDSKILVVSQANVAVDNVLKGLSFYGIDTSKLVRCGNRINISEETKQYFFDDYFNYYIKSLDNDCSKELQKYRNMWKKLLLSGNYNLEEGKYTDNQGLVGSYLLNNYSIVGATCVGLTKTVFGLDKMQFDLAIIDEAGKALPGELLIPLNRTKKIIIIGDHKQLPPVLDSDFMNGKVDYKGIIGEDEKDKFFDYSLFQHLYESCPEHSRCMLNIQFRMPTVIGEMISRCFYDSELKSSPDCEEKKPILFNNNLVFIDMEGNNKYHEQQDIIEDKFNNSNDHKSGPYNLEEVSILLELLINIRKMYGERIVVITPYKNQMLRIRRNIKASGITNIHVNTVDAFQGDEADIVIFCMTRSTKPTKYFSDSARLNVAFSRTKNMLIVLGKLSYLYRYHEKHILRYIADYIKEKGRVVNYSELQSDDFLWDWKLEYNHLKTNRSASFKPIIISKEKVLHFLPEADEYEYDNDVLYCRICKKKYESEELMEGICSDCLYEGEEYKCKKCKKDLLYTNEMRYIQKIEKAELCVDCQRELERNKIVEIGKCDYCGHIISMRKGEVEDRRNNGIPLPTICKDCKERVTYGYCKNCHKDLKMPKWKLKEYENQNKKLPACCYDCNQSEVIIGYCKGCGTSITMPLWKRDRFKEINKSLPDYCAVCNEEVTYGYCKRCRIALTMKRWKITEHERQNKRLPDYCYDCNQSEVIIGYCKSCGTRMTMPIWKRDRYRETSKPFPEYCFDCSEKIIVSHCIHCHQPITMSKWKVNEFKTKGKNWPQYCHECFKKFRY